MKKIFLIGFMGSGKSSMGRMLADIAGLPFVDMDEVVEQEANMSIAEIFSTRGESEFRAFEHKALLAILAGEPAIIATGGGVPCFDNHMKLMKDAGTVVYMQCSANELYEWLEVYKGDRPLLQGLQGESLKKWVSAELYKREPYYLEADLVIEAYHATPAELWKKLSEKK